MITPPDLKNSISAHILQLFGGKDTALIQFSPEHRSAIVSIADEMLAHSQFLSYIVECSKASEKDTATPRQELDLYLFDVGADIDEHYQDMKRMPYREFLATWYWEIVRRLVFEKHGHRCGLCGVGGPLQAHHNTYENHGREHEHLNDLTALCGNCHSKFHDKAGPSQTRRPHR